MKTEKNNKLIAEFIGFEDTGEGYTNSLDYFGDIKVYRESTGHFNDMKFNSSWDWLIPVVKKIRYYQLTHLNVGEDYYRTQGFEDILLSFDMEELYFQIIGFIKWYNKL